MRLCVVADIHGNLPALQRVMADAQERGADSYACLGDIVGYGPHPSECLDLLRSVDCRMVQGNHEAALLGLPGAEGFNDFARIALETSRERLRPEQLEELRALRPTLQISDEILLSHGSPLDRDKYLIFSREIEVLLENASHRLIFCGHSHLQFVHDGRQLRAGPLEGFSLEEDRRYLVNPGSVGQPRDRDWRTAYCLVETESWTVDQIRLEYDLEATIEAYQEAGLPEYSWRRLREGR